MDTTIFSNQQLIDEINRRLRQNPAEQCGEELGRLEEEIRFLSTRLRDSERGKSQFLSNVRNEINNPLASIIGLASSISGLSAEEKVVRLSALIHKQASDLDFQMRNIIVAAEIEMGEVKPSAARVDVVSLLENQIAYFKHQIDQHHITIQLEVSDHLKFRTDAHILQTICLNLVANAIEFCGPNKLVIIEASEKDQSLQIVVRDFGSGMDATVQKEIFCRFRQGETGLKKQHGGHGLGMSIVNELVACLDGNIRLQSEPNKGTTVTVELPALTSSAASTGSSSFGGALLFTVDEEF